MIFVSALIFCVIVFGGFLYWKYSQLFPAPSNEVVQLTPEKRSVLERLRAEAKFQPHQFPPLGYTGAETPEDRARATGAAMTSSTPFSRSLTVLFTRAMSRG
ncbi:MULTISPECIES: hypothetical protein [Bradyrhizobium]|uniref:hypothetical protein n=1 Tax=Bradyrhizobium TaxID=374 RepID=UPI0012FBB9CC|nr:MULTISPECIES: hypothetical protein [unclassified Bradyrhizobium]